LIVADRQKLACGEEVSTKSKTSIMRLRNCFLSLMAIMVGSFVATPACSQTSAPATFEYDIVIRNGRVLDGAGNPCIFADVAIKDGRFVKLGKIQGRGRTEIDAHGRYVSPGWIDMMDQSGIALPKNGLAENKLMEGVTTAIGGEGGTPVPAEQLRDFWTSLEKSGISLNWGSYFSETQARIAVLGYDSRQPTPDELAKMKSILDTAMQNGAMGMTTALIYPPSSYATTPELIEMAKVAAKYGGIYASHMRGEGKELVQSVDELIEISEKGGLPGEVFHMKAAYSPGWGTLMQEAGRHIDAARARGVDVAADLYVYTAGGTGLEATIPSWAHEGGNEALLKRLADPEIRARLKKEIVTGSPGWWNIIEASGGWQNVVLVNAQNSDNAKYQGRSIADIAKELNRDPADTAFDFVAQAKTGRVLAIYHMMSEQDIENALKFPWTSIGSDAGTALTLGGDDALGLAHPRSYGNFPRVIARYVRETHTLTLEDAIRKMTSWPATRMRIADRGLIREGMWADVVIFDYDKIQDRSTYDHPDVTPDGIDFVIVNGQVVIDHGKHTGLHPGKILYGPGYTRQ
jgi:N-acyl-D-amino-acid deacylase